MNNSSSDEFYVRYVLVSNLSDKNNSFELPVSRTQIEKKFTDYINFEHKCWTEEGLVKSPEWEERCPIMVSSFSLGSLVFENIYLRKKQMEQIKNGEKFGSERVALEDINFSLVPGGTGKEIEWNGVKYLITLTEKESGLIQ